ncbi:RNA polymerase sigma factor [Rossellomorea marisflavi]|uniref:RNA polymerase sigma factor n=1 Tax=Rossellomorea marisflavi TaxID=189381 RepID=UPI003D811048
MNADLESLGSPLRDLEREFKEKIEPYRSDLWRYCRTLTRSPWDAEDLVQDTLLRAKHYCPSSISLSNLKPIYSGLQRIVGSIRGGSRNGSR